LTGWNKCFWTELADDEITAAAEHIVQFSLAGIAAISGV
jgi:hypothetical protein